MSALVYLKDSMRAPVEVDEDFPQAINAMNLSMAKGNIFTVMEMPDGTHEAFNIPNILSIKEVKD